MTQEEKELLFKDLCARLPYKVKINCFDVPRTLETISIDYDGFVTINCGGEHFYHPLSNILHKDCLPYLRPMSSMTEEENEELFEICTLYTIDGDASTYEYWGVEILHHSRYGMGFENNYSAIDWLNSHHFDYRGLIEKGLALEAPEEMYSTK